MKATLWRSLAIGLVAVILVGCGTTAAPTGGGATGPTAAVSTDPVYGGSITIAINREAGELDIAKATSGSTRIYSRALYNSLTNLDMKGTVIPELALSWSQPDQKTWEFKLRPNVKFHDGTPFDAAAVKYNLERVLDPKTTSLWRSELAPNITAFEVVDPLTIRFKMTNQDVTVPARMSGKAAHIQSPTALQKWGNDYSLHPAGTGPFEYVEWKKDDHLTLKKYAGYWEKDAKGRQLPYLDQVTYRPIADATSQFNSLRAGDIDLIEGILPADLSKVKADAKLAAVEAPGTLQVIWLNMSKPPFDSKQIRQAFAYSIDRDAIHKGIYFNTGAPGTYFTDPNSWAYDKTGKFYNRDLAKAKALLTEAGRGNITFTGLVNNVTIEQQYAQAVKAQLAEAGITMNIEVQDATVNAARRLSGDYQVSFSGLPQAPDPDSAVFTNVRTGASVNRSRYSNPVVDAALDKARLTTVVAERAKFYAEAQAQILEDTPVVFLHLDASIKVMKASLQGYQPTFDGYIGLVHWMWNKK